MDTIPSSRKRNHPSGTLTRSRSQLFLHRNRSGHLRRDPVPLQAQPCTDLAPCRTGTSCKKPKRDYDDLPRILTKDLRSRRVYSPPLYGGSDCTDRKNNDLSAENCDTSDDAAESPDLQKEKNGGDRSQKIDDVDGGVPVLTTTLPDGEICGGSKVNEDALSTESKKNDSAFKSKSVLRPRFQGKLFRVPGSVNYKRLFPFLMDTMGDDSGTAQLGFCQKDEEDGREFQRPLSFQSQEASKAELETDGCTIPGANGSNSKKVTAECSSGPPVQGKCLNESMADSTADFDVKYVGSNLPNDDELKELSSHTNNLDHAKTSNQSACTSQDFGVLNEECILTTPPDAEMYGNSKVIVDQLEIVSQDVCHDKSTDLTRSTQENAGEGVCLKADMGKESLFKSKYVPRHHLHRKLFKTPGSVSYKRLLPFLMDLTKDDSGASKFDHQAHNQEDEADMHAKRFQLPLSCQGEASTNGHKTDSSSITPMHDTVDSNASVNYVLDDPSNELSNGDQSKLTPSQDSHELPVQLDAKEVVREVLSVPSVNKHTEKFATTSKDECFSESDFNPCSVVVDNVANVSHNDGLKEVQNKISRQQDSVSSPKDQNMLCINGDVSDLKFEHHSSKEKGFTINYDEREQFVKLVECESVSRCPPPEGRSLSQLDPNMLDAEENGTSSHAIRSDNFVVAKHVQVSNDKLRSPSKKIISEKSDIAGHGGDKAGSLLKEIVLYSRMPSQGNYNTNASEIGNGSESKITQAMTVRKRCPRLKLLKQAGSSSPNLKRLLPFLLNTVKDNSCASVNGHHPKLPEFMDQTPLLPSSTSNSQLTPVSDSNSRVPMEHCSGNSVGQQQTGLYACGLNNDSSTSKSQIPEFQSSHDSCKLIKLEDEQVVLNGLSKPESFADPSISVQGIDLPITPLAPINIIKEVLTREEKATRTSSKSSVFSEVKGNSSFVISSKEKPLERHKCCQSLSQLKVAEQLRVPAVGFKKGILKRNPRGCRGVCACLNCVSFRLHAERAFEFSKNQLLDAEEVVHDLMKELSHLRNMLEGSTGSVNGNPVFDGSQVNEACMKAIAAEELAKDRLSQMHDDLDIHSRIRSLQPPRVTFAVHVEEKIFQPDR